MATSPKRKRQKKSTSNGEVEGAQKMTQDPLARISLTREKIGSQLSAGGTATNYDIRQNVLEIQAILKTNSDVYHRIIGSICTSGSTNSSESFTRCERYGFAIVKTRLVGGKTQFITNPCRDEELFETTALSNIPDNINPNKILGVPFNNSHGMTTVDYESLFESSLIFHDDVLGPFLAKLKSRLMSVQVCLGKIDEWIMEMSDTTRFLETTFDKTLDIPKTKEELEQVCSCPWGIHGESEQCLRCKQCFSGHKYKVCPSYYNNSSERFRCIKHILLKEVSIEGSRIETTFDVSKEHDKIKLKKFLDYANEAGEAV